jgi:transcriptional regulator with XRE-family HTH domain
VAYLRHKEYLIFFGLHLKKLRVNKNMSQEDLAYDCGMEISQISRMERGLLNTSISNIYLIAKTLHIHPKEMLDFKIPEKKKK